MSVAFDGIGRLVVTFEAGTATAGSFVTMEDNGKVKKAFSGQLPVGLALHVQDGHAAVQLRGFVKTKYSGSSAPALGWASLVTDSSGGLRAAGSGESGRMCLVVEKDSEAQTMGLFL